MTSSIQLEKLAMTRIGLLFGNEDRITVCKIDLILRSIERRLQMQFSMARMFPPLPLCRYNVNNKHPKMSNFTLDSP
jgi:hypothetical protein